MIITFFELSFFLGGTLSFLLGSLIYLKNRQELVNRTFMGTCFGSAIWCFGFYALINSNTFDTAYFWRTFMDSGAVFIPVFWAHFVYSLLKITERKKFEILSYYLLALVILFLNIADFFHHGIFINDLIPKHVFEFYPEAAFGYWVLLSFYILIVLRTSYILFKNYFRTYGVERERMIYLLVASAFGYVGGGSAFFLTFNVPIAPYGIVLFIFYPVIMVLSIKNTSLFNIRVIATELFIFSLWIVLIIRTTTSNTTQDFLISSTILLATVLIGVFLIQSVIKEIKQREKLERLRSELEKVNTQLKDLNLNLQERVREQTVEVRKAYEVEKNARIKLESLDKTKSEFLSVAAHQLRTPLSGIRWALQTSLEEKQRKGESNDFLSKARDATVSLINIVHDLLNVSQIEGGGMGYVMEENDLTDTVQEAIKASRLLAEKKHITLTLKTKTESIPKFSFDREKVIMALKNVIGNAVDYTNSGGEVSLIISWEGDLAVITVIDQGIGMTEEDKKQIFTKFYRSKEARLMETDRSGLGLYITKSIIEKHGGSIHIVSQKGEGTKVRLAFPIHTRK